MWKIVRSALNESVFFRGSVVGRSGIHDSKVVSGAGALPDDDWTFCQCGVTGRLVKDLREADIRESVNDRRNESAPATRPLELRPI